MDGEQAIKAAAREICSELRVEHNVTPEEVAERIIRKVIRQTRQRG